MLPLLYTPEETFKLLGISRTHGYKMIASGELPSLKLGKLRRVPRQALEDWIAHKTTAAAPPAPANNSRHRPLTPHPRAGDQPHNEDSASTAAPAAPPPDA